MDENKMMELPFNVEVSTQGKGDFTIKITDNVKRLSFNDCMSLLAAKVIHDKIAEKM